MTDPARSNWSMRSMYGGVWFLTSDCISGGNSTTHVTCFGVEMMPGMLSETVTRQKCGHCHLWTTYTEQSVCHAAVNCCH